jgi:hypothetical protein
MTTQWPAATAADPDSIADQTFTLLAHCRAVAQYATENPSRKASAPWVRDFALQAARVVKKLIDQRMTLPEPSGKSMTPRAQETPSWVQQASPNPLPQVASAPTPEPSRLSHAMLAGAEENKVRI